MPSRRSRPPTSSSEAWPAVPSTTGALDPWSGPQDRRLLIILIDKNVEQVMWFRAPARTPIVEMTAAIIALNNQDATNTRLPDSTPYDMYSWDLNRLPDHIKAYEVPKPGIVIAVSAASREDGETHGSAFSAKRLLERTTGHTFSERLRKFLDSPDVSVEPIPIARHDVFVSYAAKDRDVAQQMKTDLLRAGLSCFIAEQDLRGGGKWTQDLRDAVAGSRVGLLLLTPRSMQSSWVMCEVGALWALGKPIVPALLGVQMGNEPDILTAFQAKSIETDQARRALVKDIAQLCYVVVPDVDAEVRPVPGTRKYVKSKKQPADVALRERSSSRGSVRRPIKGSGKRAR